MKLHIIGEVMKMASVSFELKIKDVGTLCAMIRHSDKEERLKHEHSNKEIDKSLTPNNLNHLGYSYTESKDKFLNRIHELDSTTNTNIRKDRVIAFGLEAPVPEGLTVEQQKQWLQDFSDLVVKKYGAENVIMCQSHFDEIHNYLDHGVMKTSRSHAHAIVIPEINGKLNGKKFSSLANINKMNNQVEQMSQERYGVSFLTGGDPRKQKVEDLKRQSRKEELEKLGPMLEASRQELKDIQERTDSLLKDPEQAEKGVLGLTRKLPTKDYNALVNGYNESLKQVEHLSKQIEDMEVEHSEELEQQRADLERDFKDRSKQMEFERNYYELESQNAKESIGKINKQLDNAVDNLKLLEEALYKVSRVKQKERKTPYYLRAIEKGYANKVVKEIVKILHPEPVPKILPPHRSSFDDLDR